MFKKYATYSLLFGLFFGPCFFAMMGIPALVILYLNAKFKDLGVGIFFIALAFALIIVFIVVHLTRFVFPKTRLWKRMDKLMNEGYF